MCMEGTGIYYDVIDRGRLVNQDKIHENIGLPDNMVTICECEAS